MKGIVDELHLDMHHRKNKPLQLKEMQADYALFYEEDTEPMIYYSQEKTCNIIIKLTHQGDVIKNYNNENAWEGSTSLRDKAADGVSNINSHIGDKEEEVSTDRLMVKQFGRQLLSYDLLFDCLFFNSKQEGGSKLRVPLTTLVDYKGFRALAMAHIQIQ